MIRASIFFLTRKIVQKFSSYKSRNISLVTFSSELIHSNYICYICNYYYISKCTLYSYSLHVL